MQTIGVVIQTCVQTDKQTDLHTDTYVHRHTSHPHGGEAIYIGLVQVRETRKAVLWQEKSMVGMIL